MNCEFCGSPYHSAHQCAYALKPTATVSVLLTTLILEKLNRNFIALTLDEVEGYAWFETFASPRPGVHVPKIVGKFKCVGRSVDYFEFTAFLENVIAAKLDAKLKAG